MEKCRVSLVPIVALRTHSILFSFDIVNALRICLMERMKLKIKNRVDSVDSTRVSTMKTHLPIQGLIFGQESPFPNEYFYLHSFAGRSADSLFAGDG